MRWWQQFGMLPVHRHRDDEVLDAIWRGELGLGRAFVQSKPAGAGVLRRLCCARQAIPS
jgi:hypothetical protein